MATNNQCKTWVFTLHDYTEAIEIKLKQLAECDNKFKYLVYGREVSPDTGRPHLQGYLELFTKLRLKQVKDLIGDASTSPRLDRRRGTPLEASDYCKKSDPNFYEYGSIETQQGKRNDLLAAKAFIDSGCTLEEFRENHFEVWVKYRVALEEYRRSRFTDPPVEQFPLHPWQEKLRLELAQPPDDRKVKFIVDIDGNSGKTWFANWYKQENEHVQVLRPEKRADTALQIKLDSKVIFFNVPKRRTGMIAYDILEDIKDGCISSPKYQSHTAPMEGRCHVVVLMNDYPDMSALSKDRYDITPLSIAPNPNIAVAVAASQRMTPDTESLLKRNDERTNKHLLHMSKYTNEKNRSMMTQFEELRK